MTITIRPPAGSSPRMRGKPAHEVGRRVGNGLIPAHAGKTNVLVLKLSNRGAHPRACGENCQAKRAPTDQSGSSPRMRGKRVKSSRALRASGLIPAHAGKTNSWAWAAAPMTAHPRACGENNVYGGGSKDDDGSSPRMRGKLKPTKARAKKVRLIPAHAGKTSADYSRCRRHQAHPRACGENPNIFLMP